MFLFSGVVDNAVNGLQELVVDVGVVVQIGLVGVSELVSWRLKFVSRFWKSVTLLQGCLADYS